MTKPLISVIITAHDRKQYLPFALKSIMDQTLEAAKFQVIITKNFHDKLSDGIISERGWVNHIVTERNVGQKIDSALDCAEGSIVCFLDDDDEYLPNKLSVVASAFESNPSLGYFAHNILETPKNWFG